MDDLQDAGAKHWIQGTMVQWKQQGGTETPCLEGGPIQAAEE